MNENKTPNKEEHCEHDPIKMCDPCCTCSRLEIYSLQSKLKIAEEVLQNIAEHHNTCDFCGKENVAVTEPRDYGIKQ